MKKNCQEKSKQKILKTKIKVKHPIGTKLSFIFSGLVIFVLGITVALIYFLFANDQRVNAKANTNSLNDTTSSSVETKLQSIQGNTNNYLNIVYFIKDDKHFEEEAEYFFEQLCVLNPEILFVYSTEYGYKANSSFVNTNPKAQNRFETWISGNGTIVNNVLRNGVMVKDLSEIIGEPYSLGTMFSYNDGFVCVGYDVQLLKEECFQNANVSYVVNNKYEPLIYENNEEVIQAGIVPSFDIVSEILQNSSGSEYVYTDKENENWIYVCKSILDDSCTVITLASESSILRSINLTALRIIALSFAVFFLSIIIIHFFSKSLTNPVADLVAATKSIDHGNFEIDLRPKTQDEIGYLTNSFIKMSGGLAERQRLMTTFTKFVNKNIAEKAANGQLTLGGEDKDATVFFSDIRSFTAMSEKMSAPEVVEFLNDYFTRMVDCVNKTNGIVDKFIGDAVMAVWGAATTSGSPQEDAWSAIKAALLMRIELYHFNQNQIKHGKPAIKIGCGINSGPIVAGQIGSEDHMNYTVIGDTVNLASRTEALNKPFATDILITENTYLLVKDMIIAEEMPGVHVKGKTEPIKMYAVINAKGVKGPADIHSLRKFLGWDEPELDKVNTDEEEKKYKIGK